MWVVERERNEEKIRAINGKYFVHFILSSTQLSNNLSFSLQLIYFSYISTDNRMTSSQKVLQNNPVNFNALKDLAVSINLLALQEEKRILKMVLSTPTGMVHLTDENFDDIVMRGIVNVPVVVFLYEFFVDEIVVRLDM